MRLLKRFSLLLSLTLVFALLLGGCQPADPGVKEPDPGTDPEPSGNEEKVLNIFTWATYFPDDIVEEFKAATGMTINYTTFESNEEMLMKLEAAGGGQYDLILASDYIIDIARGQGLISELDTAKIENFKNIDPQFQGQFFDPDNKYAVPYAAGIPLIVVNPAMVDFEIRGYEGLWDERLADNIVVMDDARNIIGITLKTMGESFNTKDPDILAQAKEKLMLLKPNIRALDYSTPYNLMIGDEVAVGYMFTSQVAMTLAERPEFQVIWPEEGLGFGIDACFIPSNAPHKDNAHAFLNFILDGERSARISAQTLYINCNSAAKEFIETEALVVPEGAIAGAEFIQDVGDATTLYTDIWTEFKQ